MKTNPFNPKDADRHEIWEMLVPRDIDAFLAADWSMVEDDFIEEGFMGIDAGRLSNPDSWRLNFPTLIEYRDEWLKQARDFQKIEWGEDIRDAFFRVTTLRDIEIRANSALIHKKFDGYILQADGKRILTRWQTLYQCRKVEGNWKITGFTGYLPNPLGDSPPQEGPAKSEPEQASQHTTAGPYSPVLVVNPHQLVVISGQAAIDPNGKIIGETIEEQARYTLDNCRTQLESGGCSLSDVFKVNVYLTDLADWPRFNEVYRTYFESPMPVRTAVGTALLEGLIVEVEMWAVKK